MIFIDGVGIGKEDYEYNPFFKYQFRFLKNIFGGIPSLEKQVLKNGQYYLFPSDANLGVDGLPQSGTGQTSIFCGVNAPKLIGKHFGPYPYSSLIPVVEKENIFRYFHSRGRKFNFVNAYPQVFFDYIQSGKQRLSVTTMSLHLNGIRCNRIEELEKGEALTADLTNERWNVKLGYDLPVISPETAAERLLKIASVNEFTCLEYFMTDHLGHWRHKEEFDKTIETVDRFLFSLLQNINQTELTLLICSDHGNFEDLSVKTHTRNPSLTISAGKYGEYLFNSIKDLTDIKKSIIEILG
jgi:hypothetical protein